MDPSVSGLALAALGEDLFVLSIRPRDGKLLNRGRIDSALMASELVRLAAAGRVLIAAGRITVRDRTPTGDAELDAALLSFIGAAFPPRPGTWVGLPRPGIRDRYATRLVSAGVLRMESSRLLGTPRYQVIDPSRVAAARSRLDAAAESPRPPADLARAALAGLASAIGLGAVLYPGREGRIRRARMAQIARQQVIADAAARTGGGGDLVVPGGAAAGPPDPEAAGDLPREAAAGAGGDPALLACTEEAIAAAVHALTAVIEGGAAFGSKVLGAQDWGGRGQGSRGGDGHHDGAHGDGGHGGGHWTAGGFGHH
ncbi:MAG TPA: GPP34 family phosphoprotein [Streptosporangiaceae bacterium]